MKSGREVTIYDIARALDLSPSTISRGLKDHPHIRKDTIKKIKSMAAELGYQRNKFASNLRLKRTNTIGVVVPKLNSFFMAAAIAGIEKVTSKNGYGLIISQSQESWKKEMACVTTLFNSRVDGLLVSLAFDTENLDHFDTLLNREIPVVFFDRVADCHGCMTVVIDNFKAGYEATSHLIEIGCRRIIHIGGNRLRNVYNDRFRGYCEALTVNRIKYDPELAFVTDMSSKAGTESAEKIIKMKKRPDAVFVANDTTAVALVMELMRNGIVVPGEIAVTGFNNEPVCQVIKPNLTSVEYPAMKIGEVAATSLISKLQNSEKENDGTIVLMHNLIVRDSSGAGKGTS